MKARQSISGNVTSSIFAGVLLAALSFNALAESTATLDTRAPLPATLLPTLKVSASISNPSAEVRWSIAPGRPTPVTLMPTLTVTAEATALAITNLPTVTVFAQVDAGSEQRSPTLAQTLAQEPPMLGVSD